MVASRALAHKVDRDLGEQICVGILLPPSAGAVVSDSNRGERLLVAYTDLGMSPDQVVLLRSDFARLWIPDANDFVYFAEIPALSNGKIDRLRQKTWSPPKLR